MKISCVSGAIRANNSPKKVQNNQHLGNMPYFSKPQEPSFTGAKLQKFATKMGELYQTAKVRYLEYNKYPNLKDLNTCPVYDFINMTQFKSKHSSKIVSAEILKSATQDSGSETYYIVSGLKNVLGEMSIYTKDEDIFIENLQSYAKHELKGVGSKLVQIAIEKSREFGHNGTVKLNADKLSFFSKKPDDFYLKLGFSLDTKEFNRSKGAYGNAYRLNSNQSEYWNEKIKLNKILKDR